MKRWTWTAMRCALLGCLVGCECQSDGLSPREHGTYGYTSYLFSLYEQQPAGTEQSLVELALPLRLAVAQVGEVSPPLEMLDLLRAQPALFERVQGIPGDPPMRYAHNDTPEQRSDAARQALDVLRRFSRDLGAEYLFLYGGTVDWDSHRSPLSVLDLTLVGGYVIPSRQVKAAARGSGALVDLRTGRVVRLLNIETADSAITSKMGDESTQRKVVESLRRQTITKLAEQLIEGCRPGSRVTVMGPRYSTRQ